MPRPATLDNLAPDAPVQATALDSESRVQLGRDDIAAALVKTQGIVGLAANLLKTSRKTVDEWLKRDPSLRSLARETTKAREQDISDVIEAESTQAIGALRRLLGSAIEKIHAQERREVTRWYRNDDGKRVPYKAIEAWEMTDAERYALKLFGERSALGRKFFGTKLDVKVQGEVEHRHSLDVSPSAAAGARRRPMLPFVPDC